MALKIRKQLIADTSMKFGRSNPCTYLTIHDTANKDRGANAAAHANLQSRLWDWATWHWTVDDKEAVQSYDESFQLWHAGDGRGPGNLASIAIEMCVNVDGDFNQAVANLIDLAADIVRRRNITQINVVQHNRWSGKNCPASIRAQGRWAAIVAAIWAKATSGATITPTPSPTPSAGSLTAVAQQVINGDWGNGEDRKRRLTAAGYNPAKVQTEVNRLLGYTPSPTVDTSGRNLERVAQQVINGDWGNGEDRKRRLTAAGYSYADVQAAVNVALGIEVPKASAPSAASPANIGALAQAVINGDYGNGDERRLKLGANYAAVQAEVNRRLGVKTPAVPTNITALAQAVIRGDYGNGEDRKKRLGSNYGVVQAEVNRILGL